MTIIMIMAALMVAVIAHVIMVEVHIVHVITAEVRIAHVIMVAVHTALVTMVIHIIREVINVDTIHLQIVQDIQEMVEEQMS